jgi:perosamine synthetase
MSMQFEPGALLPDGFIPLCVPEIRGNEWKYVQECLDTGWVSSVGSFVDRFEHELAALVGTKHAIATVSGTAALHIALLVAGVEPDDEVLVSTLTFIAPANAIRYVGAWPVFMDADPLYWQMDPQKVVEFLEQECQWTNGELRNQATGRRVRAILPVHILGHPVDMDPLLEVARKYGLLVIEDATESLGAEYRGKKVGHLGDIACFSFNGNKIITTGGGGMIVTDHVGWAEQARYLTTQAKDDPIEYVHDEIGYNYRLTNIQAAMGVAQLERLEEFVAAKRRIAQFYKEYIGEIDGLTLPPEADWAKSIYWLYTILVDDERFGMNSRELMRKLGAHGIQARPFWRPVHRQKPHENFQAYKIEIADWLDQKGLSLPSSVNLDANGLNVVCQAITRFNHRPSECSDPALPEIHADVT